MLIVSGPPGPPEDVKVEHVSSTTAGLSWKPGADNNSPVQIYSVQTRTPFSVGWQAVATGEQFGLAWDFLFCHTINYLKNPLSVSCLLPAPEVINGRTHRATVVDLSPWVEYEFRVVASNSVGIGEPSSPSALLRTKAAGKALLPDSFSQLSALGISLQQSPHSYRVVGSVAQAGNQRVPHECVTGWVWFLDRGWPQ